jgi:hypothetical protein
MIAVLKLNYYHLLGRHMEVLKGDSSFSIDPSIMAYLASIA